MTTLINTNSLELILAAWTSPRVHPLAQRRFTIRAAPDAPHHDNTEDRDPNKNNGELFESERGIVFYEATLNRHNNE